MLSAGSVKVTIGTRGELLITRGLLIVTAAVGFGTLHGMEAYKNKPVTPIKVSIHTAPHMLAQTQSLR